MTHPHTDPPIDALNAAIRADHENLIADIRTQAREAAARGDQTTERRHLARIDRLEALPKPWEPRSA